MKLIVVGAGDVTRVLLRGLSEIWQVTVVDVDPGALARARKERDIDEIVGDGSSRVVLERAQLERADALVAVARDDAVNLEACRLAKAAGVVRVAAVAADPERLPEYRELGVPAFSPDRLAARRIEIGLEPGRVSSASFADGLAEAIEVRIDEDSPVRGKTLRELRSGRWLVAAILRDGKAFVPHGGDILEAGDVVTVVGAAADYALIVRSFTARQARFPAAYGRYVAVALDTQADAEGPLAEAVHLTRNSWAEALLVVHQDPSGIADAAARRALEATLEDLNEAVGGLEVRLRPVVGSPSSALEGVVEQESIGVVVLPAPRGSDLAMRLAAPRAVRSAHQYRVPVLFSRGLESYAQVAVAVREEPRGISAARAAVDLASAGDVPVTAVAIAASGPATGESIRRAQKVAKRLRTEAQAVGVTARRKVRRARVLEELAPAGLVVLAAPERPPTVLQPGTAATVLRRMPSSSVLLVPPRGQKP